MNTNLLNAVKALKAKEGAGLNSGWAIAEGNAA
jgi:hypothetical protein